MGVSARVFRCGCVGLLLVACLPTFADHFPGHDPCALTHTLTIPGKEFFNGQGLALFISYIGPPSDSIITNTTFDITFVSDGTMPASELEFLVGIGLVEGFVDVSVLGSDLGFGSGLGIFVGTFQTSALNGTVVPNVPGALVDVHISHSSGNGIPGTAYFVDSTITFDVIPPPPCGQPGRVSTVPSGQEVDTSPLLVSKNGDDLEVFWDATACASAGYHLLWGSGSDADVHFVSGSDCTLDQSGSHPWLTSPDTTADWAWFLVVGNDGQETEGGWGTDSSGAERAIGASGHCGTVLLDTSTCMP